uniref:YbbM seven transmembrane helix protein n=1 Tax=uncultured Thiotrichaceae bacterium TaxID=298394 RepID=A0A6S6U401_9GAMM|nr:MAG: YbbM seven transmembrane helix protein [uncultured Thiotrichaceae bacterium]
MNTSIDTLSLTDLALAFLPAFVVVAVLFKWSLQAGNALYAMSRMLVQLLLIGYFLTYIFEADNGWIILVALLVMVLASSWIALGAVSKQRRKVLYSHALLAILVGGGVTLVIVTEGVIGLDPWYLPQYMIPLAGMIFSNSMNSVSLCAERLGAEMERGVPWLKARNIAMQASMIPLVNSLFAVGLVSLPGMMTGQILSGVSPHIAARYQIMVMCMIFGSAGIASVLFLVTSRKIFEREYQGSKAS